MTRARSSAGAGEAVHRRREAAVRAGTRAALGALAVLLLLGACGKVGPVRPPGPADQVTYPRMYPNR